MRAIVLSVLGLVAGTSCACIAMAQDQAQPTEIQPATQTTTATPADQSKESEPSKQPLNYVCPLIQLFSQVPNPDYPLTPVREQFAEAWKRDYPLLVLDLKTRHLYWAPKADVDLVRIEYQGFAPQVTTTDNVIVLICNAMQGDGSTINASSVVVNGPDANVPLGLDQGQPRYRIHRMFLLDAAKGNDITRVDFVGPTITKGQVAQDFQAKQYESQLAQDNAAIERDTANLAVDNAAINPNEKDPAKAASAKAKVAVDQANLISDQAKLAADSAAGKTTDRVTDTIATVLVERHRVIHFSAGGGLLFTWGRSTNFSTLTVPTTVTTTTTVSSTTVLTGTTTPIGSNSQSTSAVTNGTANFATGTLMDRPQINGIAGLTWYLFGHDTFPVNQNGGYTVTYSSKSLKGSFGLFFGTSVSSLGNFTVAPALEVMPGIQLFAGPSWYSRPSQPSNVTACSGIGMSPSFAGPTTPASTQTQSVPGPPATTATTTTIVTTTTTNGCTNGDKATLLAGSNIPTQSHYATAFAFGLVFNTNLFKAFSGIK